MNSSKGSSKRLEINVITQTAYIMFMFFEIFRKFSKKKLKAS